MHPDLSTKAALSLLLATGVLGAASPEPSFGNSGPAFSVTYAPSDGTPGFNVQNPQFFDLFLSGLGAASRTMSSGSGPGNTLTVVANSSRVYGAADFPGTAMSTFTGAQGTLGPINLTVTKVSFLSGGTAPSTGLADASGASTDGAQASGSGGPVILQFTVDGLSYGSTLGIDLVTPSASAHPGYTVATYGFPSDFALAPGLNLIAPGLNLPNLILNPPNSNVKSLRGVFWFWLPWTESSDDVSASLDAGMAGKAIDIDYTPDDTSNVLALGGTKMLPAREDWWDLTMTQGENPIEGVQMSYSTEQVTATGMR